MDNRSFEEQQQARIRERIARYNNVDTVKEQLSSTGDISPYQRYKIDTVTAYLYQALRRLEVGRYGICVVCGGKIAKERLILVPAALACVGCDEKRET